jgi:polysaccharide biosynthesis/export protein
MRNSVIALVLISTCVCAAAQEPVPVPGAGATPVAAVARNASAPVVAPAGYTIGPDDRLAITFWRNTELSAEVVVRPDGRISLPLLNDIDAAGLTPDELRGGGGGGGGEGGGGGKRTMCVAFVEDANATVVVAEIRSRRVFISGNVDKPGAYPLNGPTTVLQLIATAGGLREFVKGKNIVVVRGAGDRQARFKFNYQDVVAGKRLAQNVTLQPGDTVIVP